jgi:hypothetical protein
MLVAGQSFPHRDEPGWWASVTKGQRAFFLVVVGRLVAGQSSPHRHEAEGGGVAKGQGAFCLIIVGEAFSLPNFRSHG